MSRWALSASRLALAASFLLTGVHSNAQNLVLDPHFSSSISAWTVTPSPGITVIFLRDPGPGVDGAPGFATLSGPSLGPIFYSASTCVPVQPGVVYSFGGNVRFRSSQPSSGDFTLDFFSDATCGTEIPEQLAGSSQALGDTPGRWTLCQGFATALPGAASAKLLFIFGTSLFTVRPAADFDDVFVGRAGTVGPALTAVPVPFVSRAGVLALGLALALSGALAVRLGGR